MDKNYWEWHNLKSKLQQQLRKAYFRERDIWWCHIGANIGYEQDGTGDKYFRPVLVLRKFNNEIFLGIPLTQKSKLNKFHYELTCNGIKSYLILTQIRLYDGKRLARKIRRLPKNEISAIRRRLQDLI